jgi:DNA-binding MurR/RpiR family transcriptional regulator
MTCVEFFDGSYYRDESAVAYSGGCDHVVLTSSEYNSLQNSVDSYLSADSQEVSLLLGAILALLALTFVIKLVINLILNK